MNYKTPINISREPKKDWGYMCVGFSRNFLERTNAPGPDKYLILGILEILPEDAVFVRAVNSKCHDCLDFVFASKEFEGNGEYSEIPRMDLKISIADDNTQTIEWSTPDDGNGVERAIERIGFNRKTTLKKPFFTGITR